MKNCIIFLLLFMSTIPFSCVEQIQPVAIHQDNLESISIIIGRNNYFDLIKANFTDRWFSIKYYDSNASNNARIRNHGKLSRHYPKKTFKVKVYKGYPEKIAQTYQLSAQYSDNSFCRYRLGRLFFKRAGFLCSDVSPVHLSFDNRYYGVALRIEFVDKLFFQKRKLPISSLYKIKRFAPLSTKSGLPPQGIFEKKLPLDDLTYNDLERLLTILDRGININNIDILNNLLDIENALDYYIVSVLINHYDGITANYYLYYNSLINKFQFIPWDLDLAFYHPPDLNQVFLNNLFEQLLALGCYNSYIKKRMKEIFNYDEFSDSLNVFANEVDNAIHNDPWLTEKSKSFNREIAGLQWYLRRLNSLLKALD